jgi:hypothetical protein
MRKAFSTMRSAIIVIFPRYLDITPLGRQGTWEDSPESYPQIPCFRGGEEILADSDLTTALKGKTMTKPGSGDSEVGRDLSL